jgi:hypothetical protein
MTGHIIQALLALLYVLVMILAGMALHSATMA